VTSRAQRRHVDRQIAKLARRDTCSVCGGNFEHNGRTFGGLDRRGDVALVGTCCQHQMAALYVVGVYYNKRIDVVRRAGIPNSDAIVFADADTPWSQSDRAWFAARPQRAHRLRPPLDGELAQLLRYPEQVPPGHATEVLVRQVQPGLRVRRAFHRNVRIGIPDNETVLHALFDIIAQQRPASVRDVATLALLYSEMGGAS
jgi:hypothetical protein